VKAEVRRQKAEGGKKEGRRQEARKRVEGGRRLSRKA
jgi:hypothetical protein